MTRMRWLGPGLFGGGAVIAAIGIWYFVHARPVPGAEIDSMRCSGATLVVRSEQGGDRSFIELRADGEVKWQALIPHYAGGRGRPAVACGDRTLTVRVERGGRAEVFGFDLRTGDKAGGFRLAPEHEPNHVEPTGPITLTDHVYAYEIVGGAGWHQIIKVDLASGEARWKHDLGPDPVTGGGVSVDGSPWVQQGGRKRDLASFDGSELP